MVSKKLNTKENNLENKIYNDSTLLQTNQYITDRQNLGKRFVDFENKIPHTSSLVTTTVLNNNNYRS